MISKFLALMMMMMMMMVMMIVMVMMMAVMMIPNQIYLFDQFTIEARRTNTERDTYDQIEAYSIISLIT